jgi:hypothetical protein
MEPLHDVEISLFLTELEKHNYAVKHFFFRPIAIENAHHAVAEASLIAIKKKSDAYLYSSWKMSIDWETLNASKPTKLLPEEFLGTRFHFPTKQLFQWDSIHGQKWPRYWFLSGEKRTKENAKTPLTENGYSYAVCSPCHRGVSPELFQECWEKFFGDLETLEIYAWTTDCSNYFDAGKEWWGEFFWTVYSPTYDWYVGILASDTD